MNKVIAIFLTASTLFLNSSKAQEMDLGSSSSQGATVTFDGTVIFTDGTISLDGAKIICKTLVIKKTVNTIKITGKVIINCESLKIETGGATDLTFDIKGKLEGYYTKDFDGNGRKIKIIGVKNEGFTITEKTD